MMVHGCFLKMWGTPSHHPFLGLEFSMRPSSDKGVPPWRAGKPQKNWWLFLPSFPAAKAWLLEALKWCPEKIISSYCISKVYAIQNSICINHGTFPIQFNWSKQSVFQPIDPSINPSIYLSINLPISQSNLIESKSNRIQPNQSSLQSRSNLIWSINQSTSESINQPVNKSTYVSI